MNNLQAQLDSFISIDPEKAEQLVQEKAGSIIFVGRPNCPFCQKFIPKLYQVAQDHKLDVYYLYSQDPKFSEEIQAFRNKHGIETVPGLVYAGSQTMVRCDSSMTPEEIAEFVHAKA